MSDSAYVTIIVLILLEEYAWDHESEWAMMFTKSEIFLDAAELCSAARENIKCTILKLIRS